MGFNSFGLAPTYLNRTEMICLDEGKWDDLGDEISGDPISQCSVSHCVPQTLCLAVAKVATESCSDFNLYHLSAKTRLLQKYKRIQIIRIAEFFFFF